MVSCLRAQYIESGKYDFLDVGTHAGRTVTKAAAYTLAATMSVGAGATNANSHQMFAYYCSSLRGQIVAEMEMRKESDLGGLDENGHVKTYEEQKMGEEDKELETDTASEEGIKDEDFEETKVQVKDLRRLLNEIQSMQQKERRRLTVHAETNEHSHSRMVLNSLLETLLFMAVTGYQVYTIRKWFSGAPVLGR